jgi:hypothetical protein
VTTVAIELKTACGRCGENIPVNAVVTTLWCQRCQSPVTLDPATWKEVLEGPALDGPVAEPGKVNASVVKGSRPLMRSFVRRDAACARCGAKVPDEDVLAHAGRGWCVCGGCGESQSVRALPASFAGLGGITHLIGEDATQLAARGPAQGGVAGMAPVSAPCGTCGAALPVDASSPRSVGCRFCGNASVLSDAIWQRLHPVATQRAWFIRKDPAAGASVTTEAWFGWKDIDDVVMGHDGNLYFLGTLETEHYDPDRTSTVWSCDPYFKRRWVRHGVPRKSDDGHLAMTADGHILAWEERRHGLLKLSAENGATVATLGGKEPPGSQAHHLDLQHCTALVAHLHGTILGFLHDRVLRWAPDGTPVETWVHGGGLLERRQKWSPLYRVDADGDRRAIEPEGAPSVNDVKDRPTEMRTSYVEVTAGWDGSLYVYRSEHLLKLGPDGARHWCVELPKGSDHGRPGIDAWGNVYVLRSLRSSTHGIYRVSPDGSDVRLLVDGGATGTPMGEERYFVVHPQGALFVLAYGGVARVFAADGSARFASPKARADDEYRAKKRARDGDDDD